MKRKTLGILGMGAIALSSLMGLGNNTKLGSPKAGEVERGVNIKANNGNQQQQPGQNQVQTGAQQDIKYRQRPTQYAFNQKDSFPPKYWGLHLMNHRKHKTVKKSRA